MKSINEKELANITGGICEVNLQGMTPTQLTLMAVSFYAFVGYMFWTHFFQENG